MLDWCNSNYRMIFAERSILEIKREVDVAYNCFSWRCLIMIGKHANCFEDVFNRRVFRHVSFVATPVNSVKRAFRDQKINLEQRDQKKK